MTTITLPRAVVGKTKRKDDSMMMTTKTLFRWEQDPSGGDHGTLILWPDTRRELRMIVQDFKTAHTLGMSINGVTNEAFEAGRRSMQAEVARIVA